MAALLRQLSRWRDSAPSPTFAREADVSTPSVLRLAKKFGLLRLPTFQDELRSELSAQLQNPSTKHDRWAAEAPDTTSSTPSPRRPWRTSRAP